jgi:hypothetical protein
MTVSLSIFGGVAAQFFDNNGVILSGGKIYTYTAGTTVPLATYTSENGATAHTNPIVLDSAGRVPGGELWLTNGLGYKFVLETADAVLIGTYDNVLGGSDAGAVAFNLNDTYPVGSIGQAVKNRFSVQGSLDQTLPFDGNGGAPVRMSQKREYSTDQSLIGNVAQATVLKVYNNPIGSNRYNVAESTICYSFPGCSDVWARNDATYIEAGVNPATNHYVHELNINNSSGDYGDDPFIYNGPQGVFEAAMTKYVAGGPNRITSAILIYSPTGALFNRGIALYGDSVVHADFQTSTNASNILLATGEHQIGLNLAGCDAATMTYALTTPEEVGLGLGKPGGGFVDIKVNTSNVLEIGSGSAGISTSVYLAPSGLVLPAGTPASGSAGTEGEIRVDTNYIYVCVAANTWKRAALSSY